MGGLLIAAAGPELAPLGPPSDPGIPGKFGWHFVLPAFLVFGWALGAGIEAAWRSERDDLRSLAEAFALAAVPRLFAGAFLFFALVGATFGFEALGVGFGWE